MPRPAAQGQAERLREAGTTAYNHNLNTAEARYGDICTTHSYDDRAATVQAAKGAGLSPCSGLIAGMGESDEDLVDVAFALRDLDPNSVPVNFLIPFLWDPARDPVEPHAAALPADPGHGAVRLPGRRGRPAAGREIHLRSMQPLALHIVNSIFLGDYLTSEGQSGQRDLDMITDAGFVVEGAADDAARAPPRPGGGPPPRGGHRPAR